jgi:Zn-dependent oligopeptidase
VVLLFKDSILFGFDAITWAAIEHRMKIPIFSLILFASLGELGLTTEIKPQTPLAWPELQRKAARFGTVLTLPKFENSPQEIAKSTDAAIAKANAALDAIGRLEPKKITFRNTVRALDDLLLVMENAVNEETRKKVYLARANRAREKNLEALKKMIQLRGEIARILGYDSWADYQTEIRMAKNGATPLAFLEKLKTGLEPKFRAELDEFKQIKAASNGSTTPDVNLWDWWYCAEKLRQEKYQVDAEALRIYFPYEKVLQGMFNVYERIFGIQIQEISPPSKYTQDLRLYAVIDKNSGAPLGMFYMDMFPRPGKYNHFANFSIIDGKRLAGGRYQRPTTSLICNFPPPTKEGPSLMTHDDVTTIWHAMHAILTQAKYARFAGTNVPQDFVEAPSQMLEYFTWDKTVLDSSLPTTATRVKRSLRLSPSLNTWAFNE